MAKDPDSAEYIAALCHWRDGGLIDYDSKRLVAVSEAEAKREGSEWAATALGRPISEKTWLQITRVLDGKAILSQVFGKL
jgi:hypothetical protein